MSISESDSESESAIRIREISSLTQHLQNAAEANNVDDIKSTLQQARSTAAFWELLGAGLATGAHHGHVDAVKYLLDEGKSALSPQDLLPALLHALSGDHNEVVPLLLDSGAPVNSFPQDGTYWEGWSPVSMAVFRNNFQMLHLLIARGADVDAENVRQQTALHLLAGNDSWQITSDSEALDMLFQYARKVHSQDAFGCTPLYSACMVNNTQLVRKLLQKRNGLQASLAAADPNGCNALHIATQHASCDIVRMLLAHGADPNVTRNDEWSPLHIACNRYYEATVRLLLANGAMVNKATSNGIFPLHLAIRVGAVEVVEALLERKDLEMRDVSGDHAFFLAAELGEMEIANLLLPSFETKSLSDDESQACEMFKATITDFGEDGQRLDLRILTISQLLSRFIPQPSPVSDGQSTALRWIHITANNPTWVEALLMRWAHSHGDVKDVKRLCNLGLSHAHRGQYPHSRFYRPTCQGVGKHIWTCIPYLHFETTDRYRKMQAAINRTKQSPMPSSVSQKLTRDELLIRAYPMLSPGGAHIRRTLDQFFFPNLDTRYRDHDQVVFRYQLRANHPDPKIYMVDQLWVIVLADNLVVTSFPQRWEQPENDRFDILAGVLDTLKEKPIHNVQDLVAAITDRCCGIFDRYSPNDEEYQFLAMFEESVGIAAENEARRYSELHRASSEASAWLKGHRVLSQSSSLTGNRKNAHNGGGGTFDNPRFVDEFLDFAPETNLIFEIKDIRDEMGMIRSVLDHQRAILPELESRLRALYPTAASAADPGKFNEFSEQGNMVDMYLKDLERIDKQAAHLYESVVGLLDLKQKQANPFEARLSRELAAGTARQSKTIMIFTIVTIIFLPLSFITSFFTIDIAEFPRSAGTTSMPLSFVSRYIFGAGFAISIPLILLAFAAQDFKLGFRALYDALRRERATESRPSVIDEQFDPELNSGPTTSRASVSASFRRSKTRASSPGKTC